jgi:hypothetical protein
MPRYYKYGFQGPQYAGSWSHQIPTPQTQAPGLRYGLGDVSDVLVAQAESFDLSKLSDKELDVLIVFYQEGIASPGPKAKPEDLAKVQVILTNLRTERARRERSQLLLFGGAAAVGLYFLFWRK